MKNDQVLLAGLLAAKAKSEADYDNPKWYRNIIFDEDFLNKLSQLFPKRRIKTDYDATKLIEEFGDNALIELQKRMEKK